MQIADNKGYRIRNVISGAGCLTAVLGPLIALIVYPRANWLFILALIGTGAVLINILLAKDPTARSAAEDAERILDGTSQYWAIDDYEHLNPHEPRLRELWRRTFRVGGMPEEWAGLAADKKAELREVIAAMRKLETDEGSI